MWFRAKYKLLKKKKKKKKVDKKNNNNHFQSPNRSPSRPKFDI
jgi:hypothetical protein